MTAEERVPGGGGVPAPSPTQRREWAAVALIALAALMLRLWGTGFGLPFTYHPDEHQYVDTAIAVVGGELDPGRFNNPSALKYALAAVDTAWFAAGRASGTYRSLDDFVSRHAIDPGPAYRLARAFVALLGAATVLVAWRLGRAAYGPDVGIAAAALLSGMYLHVRESHFAVSDVPATLLTTAAVLLAVRVLRGGSRADYVAAGVLVGLAAATKYSAVAVAVPIVTAHVLAGGSRPADWPGRLLDRRLWVTGAAAVAAFLAAVPFAIASWPAFRTDVLLLLDRGREGFKGLQLSPGSGWWFYLDALRWGLGVPLLTACLAGLAAALVRHRRIDVVMVALPIVLYAHLGRQLLLFERFILPALPVLAVLTADAVLRLARRSSTDPGRQRLAAAAVLALLLAPSVAYAVRFDRLLGRSDTRTLAKAWIETNVAPGAKVLVHSNGPELAGGDRAAPASRRAFDLTVAGTTQMEELPLEAYVEEGYDFVVTSSFSTHRRLLDPVEDTRRREYFAAMAQRFPVAAAFRPFEGPEPPFAFAQIYGPAADLWRFERPGPIVTIYRVPSR